MKLMRSVFAVAVLCAVAPQVVAQEAPPRSTVQLTARAEADATGSLLASPARLEIDGVHVAEALMALQTSSGIALAFSPSLLPPGYAVSCACRRLSVAAALDRILDGTGFRYLELGTQILLEPEAEPRPDRILLASATPAAAWVGQNAPGRRRAIAQQTGTILGQVVEATTRRPLVSAQVSIQGTGMGTLTGANGRFQLVGVPDGNATISVSLIGYGSVEREVTVTSGESVTADFELTQQALALDEVVVTGTAGQARRREVGNSIASITSERLAVQPIQVAEDAIAGQVPGAIVMGNEGVAGAGGSIRIRGINSMTQGNSPLIYVDGVRIYNRALPGTAQGQSASPLNSINPSDIDRIEIVKGAAATTLYGTEASSGVIQIFTKKGTGEGGASWDAQMTQGMSVLPQIGPTPSQAWFDHWGDSSAGLWMDQWTRRGSIQEYALSVRGSATSDGLNYYLSGGWGDEQGVLPNQGATNAHIRGNLGFQPLQSLGIQFNSSVSTRDITWIPGGNLAKSFTLNTMRGPFDYTQDDDSVFFTEFDTRENLHHFTSGVEVRFTPAAAFSTKLNLGLDYIDSDYNRTEIFGSLLEPNGYRQARRFRNVNRTIDLQSTYTRNIAGIATSTSAGFQVFDSGLLTIQGTSSNFAGPGNPTLNTGSQQNTTESRLNEVNAGFFVQEMLGFADKLFLTAGMRVDGNSAFGSDYGLQTYPKLSASYVLSDEPFWPSALQSTKLRMAYGESGKAPGYFDAERAWSPISGNGGQPGVTPLTRGNPNLGPERSRELEAGIEIAALDGRVTVDASVYRQETTDALLEVPQDPTLGYLASQIANVGTIRNRGYEISVNGTLVRTEGLAWEVGVSASGLRSEMADMGGSSDVFVGAALSPGLWVKEGYPVPGFFGPKLQNPDEIGAPEVEEEYFGPIYPTRTFILSSLLNLGQRLTGTVRGEYQGGHYNLSHTAWRNAQRGVWPPCFDVSQRIAAGELSQLTAKERYECGNFSAQYGAYLVPADFFRLRSVGVTYRVPEAWTTGFGQWTASLGARNVLLLTEYVGLDPELNQGGDTLGRHEYYQVPAPRTFTFSLRTSF